MALRSVLVASPTAVPLTRCACPPLLLCGDEVCVRACVSDKPLLSDAIVPGDDESVDMFLAKHPEVPLASDHDDELDDYVGPMVSTVEDEKDALNHHPGGQICRYFMSIFYH